jgi:D-3-phosphoglycerate dehydrogenase / 2-oxoglutarate reductase
VTTKNILLVNDFAFSSVEMLKGFKSLQNFDVRISTAEDHPDITPEEFQEKMLRMETRGPESIAPPLELMEKVENADILIIHYTVITEKVIEAAKNLKLLGVLRGGIDNVNMAAISKTDIQVVNAPGRSAEAVSDFTIGLMLAESRNIVRGNTILQKGEWSREFQNSAYSHNLKSAVLGMIGFGAVGEKIAQKLSGFKMKILVYDPYVPKDKILSFGCEPVELNDLLSKSDFISLHARLTKDNSGLICEESLAMMKPTAFVINTARAGLIDEIALIDALKNKRIGGAALDVFATEPLPQDSPFLNLDNVCITPHLAGVSCDTLRDSFEIMTGELERYLKNEALQFLCK